MEKNKSSRYEIIDVVRGFAIINMVAYHALWDMVYIFGRRIELFGTMVFETLIFELWQLLICSTFIMISGFCQPFSRSKFKNGVLIFAGGALVSVVSCVFMPENKIIFGILTMLGLCCIIHAAAEKMLNTVPPAIGLIVSILLFVILKNINDGYASLFSWKLFSFPRVLYNGYTATCLGFTDNSFYSADYFSVMPWIFLFEAGFFLNRLLSGFNMLSCLSEIPHGGIYTLLSYAGRHSLVIYILHQPVVYGILWLVQPYFG